MEAGDDSVALTLERLGHAERLDEPSERLGLPHLPEHDARCFKDLYFPELVKALDVLDARLARRRTADDLAWRGRVRRLLGDSAGAADDLLKALDLRPGLARAHAWLAEIDLLNPQAEAGLSRAVDLDPRDPWARLYRGAARLMSGRADEAAADLEAAAGLKDSALVLLLLGLAEERRAPGKAGRARACRAYKAAARLNPVCSAVYLLLSRAAPSLKEEARWFREAYNVSPVLGFITLQIHRSPDVEAPAYVRKIRKFAFAHPEKVGAYYRREATQSHFSHFPAEDYSFVEKLVARNDGLAWAHAFFGRAACYTEKGAPEGVRRLSRAVEQAPHCGWFYAWRANAWRVLGKTAEAEKDFAEAIRLQPFYHRSFVWRGGLYRRLGRVPEALADLDRALAMDPYYSLTYYERSMARRAAGDLLGSALDLDRAYMLDHRYAWVFKTGGEPRPEDFERGRAELDRGVAAFPGAVSLLAWRGHLSLCRRDFSAAASDLTRACALDPHHAQAFGWLGQALLLAGEAARALPKLSRAVELSPRFWAARGWLAEALFATGRRKEARAVVDAALAEKRASPWAHLLRARFFVEEGRWRQAVGELERALKLDGKYPEAYLLLSQARLALGQAAAAERAAERCVEIAPNLGRAYLARAAARQRVGNAAGVVADYRRVLTEFPYLFNGEERARVARALEEAGAAA